MSNEQKIWEFCKGKGMTDWGVAGLMGNLKAESGLIPNNLQNNYEKSLGYSDTAYTKAVDDGSYNNFVHDSAGYGLAQWTYHTRKQNLLSYAKSMKCSIGDLDMQLNFLWDELLTTFPKVLKVLCTADSVREASDSVLLDFEKPKHQDESVQLVRAQFGQEYFDKYRKNFPAEKPSHWAKPYTVMPKICLDPGHYGRYNQSPEVPGYYESEAMWKLHLLLKSALERRGFQVITTRKDPAKDLGLTARGSMAKGCDCFISLHSNATGKESVDYTIVYRAWDNLNEVDGIATRMGLAIGKLMGNRQTGKSGYRKSEKGAWDYYGVMHGARKAGCPLYLLIEHSFHTNKAATLWLMQEANLRKLAELEADILAEHYGMKPGTAGGVTCSATPEPPTLATGESYQVRVTASELNIRQGPSKDHAKVGCITDQGVYTIVAEQAGWGKLKSGAGWICLAYTERK